MSDSILNEYDSNKELYERFTLKAHSLIREILASHGINVHSVTYRTKDRSSLAKKLSKQGSNYASLNDVTDISGVRITTYFEDDVDRVVRIIEQEFQIDKRNSVDKRSLLDPDRFGYLSTHHVINLSAGRCSFPEYRRFQDVKLEIQTRSILQHAWAEIEHDLGYKSKQEVPRDIRRRFSRLAGLLELADNEFIAIRDELANYDEAVLGQIASRPDIVEIDRSSLIAFVDNSKIVKELDAVIAAKGKWKLQRVEDEIASDIKKLHFAGIKTIGELEQLLTEHRELIKRFANKWIKKDRQEEDCHGDQIITCTGISIFYLLYVLLCLAEDRRRLINYLSEFQIGGSDDDFEEVADEIRQVYKKVVSEC